MTGMADIAEIRERHRRLRDELTRRVASALARASSEDYSALVALLEGELLAYARAERARLYPVVDALVREHGRATATMEVDHEHIARCVAEVSAAVERLRATTERAARMSARSELRDALLRLGALLELHLEKEERVYLPLLERHLAPDEQRALVRDMREPPAAAAPGEIDVRTIPQRERHARVFAAFEALPVGSSLVLLSDHDPRPLSYQLRSRHRGAYAWDDLERGPLWRVRITRTTTG